MKDSGILIHDNADKVPPAAPGKHPLTPVSGADFHRPGLRLPAQAWLILTVACLLPLLLALWGLYGVIERMTLLYPWLMDVLGFALFAAFLGVIVGTPIAAAFRIWIGTMHARVVRTAHGAMADVVTVMGVTQQAAEGQQAALIETMAVHNQFATPNLSTLSAPGGKAEKAADVPALPAPQEGLTPFDTWRVWADEAPHLILAAETKGGKTTTAKAILGPRIDAGEHVFIIDPHSDDWFGLPNVGGGENWVEVGQAMRSITTEYQHRMQERDRYLRETGHAMPVEAWTRLTVLLDEGNITRLRFDMKERRETNRWQEFVEVLGSGARKVRIGVILLCQSANVEDLGMSGSMRRNFFRIGLDHAVARLMLKDEPNPERRKMLYAQLEGQQFPAVCEYRGQFYALDRTGVDRVPAPRAPQSALWLGWSSAPREVKPSPRELVLKALRAAREKGLTRDEARGLGLHFDNNDWSEAEKAA